MVAQAPAPPQPAYTEPQDQGWYRALFQHATDLIIVLDAEGKRSFVSPSVHRLMGYTVEEYVALPTWVLAHPDDLPRLQAGHAACLARPGPQEPFRYRVRHADGEWRAFEGIRNNLLADPQVRGMVITSRDITAEEQAKRRLHASEAQFRSAFASAAVGMALVGLDGRWLAVNPAVCAITGRTEAELLGRRVFAVTHPDDAAVDRAHAAELVAGAIGDYQLEKRFLHPDGSVVWAVQSVSLVKDEEGAPTHFVAQILDISARLAAEQTLRDSEARFRALLANAGDMVLLLGERGEVRWASNSVQRVLGVSPGELVGRSNVELVHPADRHRLRRAFVETVRAAGEPHTTTLRFRHRDGGHRWLEAVSCNYLEIPAIAGVVVNARDVSDRVALQERLRQEALHDALTGLPNRVKFEEQVRANLVAGGRYGERTAVLFIDLDGFKAVNDSLGHAAGDQLLQAVGRRLAGNVRPTDLVARLGGDEFAVALGRIKSPAEVDEIARRLLAVLTIPVPIAGATVTVGASIGRAISAVGGDDPAALIAAADEAMYAQKHGRRAVRR